MDDTTWGTDFVDWRERAFAPPAPREVKLATIMRCRAASHPACTRSANAVSSSKLKSGTRLIS